MAIDGGFRAAFMLPSGVEEAVILETGVTMSETERGESRGGSNAVEVVGEPDIVLCEGGVVLSEAVDGVGPEET